MIWSLTFLALAIAGVAIYRYTLPSPNSEKESYCTHGSCRWISGESKDFDTSQGPLLVNKKQGWFYGTIDELYWTPQNALWKDGSNGVTYSKHYWQIHVIKFKGPGFNVGVTTMQLFQPGWSLRGLMFGQGRRRNGYDHLEDLQLEPIFGPNIKPGDIVGIYLELSGSRAKVYFDVNDISLGMAFDVSSDRFISLSEAQSDAMPEFFPVVQFFNEGVVKIKKSWGWPSSLKRTWIKPHEGMNGPWEYIYGSIDSSGSPTTKATLNLNVKNENTTLGELDIWNTNIIRWTRTNPYIDEWKGHAIDIILLGNGHTPDFEREMFQFLITDGLTWSMPHKESLVIKDISKGKVTSWKRPVLEPIELKPLKTLGKNWPIK